MRTIVLYIFIAITLSPKHLGQTFLLKKKMDIENFNTHYCPIKYKKFLSVDWEIKIEVGYYNRCYWFPTSCPQSPPSSPEAGNFLLQVLFHSHTQQPQSARGNSHTQREKNQWLNLLAALSLGRAILSCILQDY